jgi:hypothetical protein
MVWWSLEAEEPSRSFAFILNLARRLLKANLGYLIFSLYNGEVSNVNVSALDGLGFPPGPHLH